MNDARLWRWLLGLTAAALTAVAAWYWFQPSVPAELRDGVSINITYPYVASPERERQIRDSVSKIGPGLSVGDVTDLLGSPDESRPLYDPESDVLRRVGSTYWYFLEKQSAENNLGAKVVRITFDLNERVIQVDVWGFDAREP